MCGGEDVFLKGKCKSIHGWAGHQGCKRLRLPEFLFNRKMKVVQLSAFHTGRLYLPVDMAYRGLVDARAIVRPE
jgi:hypothetical protein